ncbi:MAG: carboxypeptidase-like regulatory domain-containing protein [Thermoplasmatota archaeon]
MRATCLLLLLSLTLAGCAEETAGPTPAEEGPVAQFDEVTGAVRGVVVDEQVVPVAGVTVTLADTSTTTDADGSFVFNNVVPGSYVLEASSPLHNGVQQTITVAAGEATDVVKIQMTRLFSEDPYVEPFQFKGRLACHLQAGLTAPCVTDFTQIVPGCGNGCVPQLRTALGDSRDFIYEITGGWQTHVVELTWKPTSVATSQNLGIIVRDFAPGGANHQYASSGGSDPVWLRIDCCDPHPTQGGPHSLAIPPEGYDNIMHFTGVRTEDGQPAALAVEQEFEVFLHTFYYGIPPEGWSFLAGDSNPF